MTQEDPFAPLHQPTQTGLWTGNLILAAELVVLALAPAAELADKDRYYRAATSKVYYALFHYALDYAAYRHPFRNKRIDPNDRGHGHSKLIDWYWENGTYRNGRAASIESALAACKELRTVVDYQTLFRYYDADHVDAETCCIEVYQAARPALITLTELRNP